MKQMKFYVVVSFFLELFANVNAPLMNPKNKTFEDLGKTLKKIQ